MEEYENFENEEYDIDNEGSFWASSVDYEDGEGECDFSDGKFNLEIFF